MKINNFDLIKKLLVFKDNTYYFIQVIQRRKENPELERGEINRGNWFIKSEKDLLLHWDRIEKTCVDYNARAYISLTPRSLEKFGALCAQEYLKRVIDHNFSNIERIPQKIALNKDTIQSRGIIKKQRWVIDVDSNDSNYKKSIENYLLKKKINILLDIPTVNGNHFIIEAFDITSLGKAGKDSNYKTDDGKEFTLRKECNTILYAVYKS